MRDCGPWPSARPRPGRFGAIVASACRAGCSQQANPTVSPIRTIDRLRRRTPTWCRRGRVERDGPNRWSSANVRSATGFRSKPGFLLWPAEDQLGGTSYQPIWAGNRPERSAEPVARGGSNRRTALGTLPRSRDRSTSPLRRASERPPEALHVPLQLNRGISDTLAFKAEPVGRCRLRAGVMRQDERCNQACRRTSLGARGRGYRRSSTSTLRTSASRNASMPTRDRLVTAWFAKRTHATTD